VSRAIRAKAAVVVLALAVASATATAQTSSPQPKSYPGCLGATSQQLSQDTQVLWHGLKSAPRNAIRPRNLKWELPIAAATGIMIATVDTPASRRVQSVSFENLASRWSNIGLGLELGSAGLAWAVGCAKHNDDVRGTGFLALEAAGAAAGINEVVKFAADRQFPSNGHSSTSEFWEGGRSFPSGHSAASFAFASVVAHRTHRRWVQVLAYGLATGVSLSRFPAKKHFPSDILVGATIGYVTGTYLAGPQRPEQ